MVDWIGDLIDLLLAPERFTDEKDGPLEHLVNVDLKVLDPVLTILLKRGDELLDVFDQGLGCFLIKLLNFVSLQNPVHILVGTFGLTDKLRESHLSIKGAVFGAMAALSKA